MWTTAWQTLFAVSCLMLAGIQLPCLPHHCWWRSRTYPAVQDNSPSPETRTITPRKTWSTSGSSLPLGTYAISITPKNMRISARANNASRIIVPTKSIELLLPTKVGVLPLHYMSMSPLRGKTVHRSHFPVSTTASHAGITLFAVVFREGKVIYLNLRYPQTQIDWVTSSKDD